VSTAFDVLYGCEPSPVTCFVIGGRVYSRPSTGPARLAGSFATGREAEEIVAKLLAVGFKEAV